jgi:hypothetical protein
MRRRTLLSVAVVMPMIAACGAEADLTNVGTTLRSEGTLHDFCTGEAIPVWAGAGNPASASRSARSRSGAPPGR